MRDFEPHDDEFTATVDRLSDVFMDYADPYEMNDQYDDPETARQDIRDFVEQNLRDDPARIVEELRQFRYENEGDQRSETLLGNLIDRVEQEFMPDEPKGKDISPIPTAAKATYGQTENAFSI